MVNNSQKPATHSSVQSIFHLSLAERYQGRKQRNQISGFCELFAAVFAAQDNIRRYFYLLYTYSILFHWEGSAKTHIYIDICMRVNIKIPETIITDASSCSFPLVILQVMDGQMERGLLLVCPMEHNRIPSPLKGPLASHGVWFMQLLTSNLALEKNSKNQIFPTQDSEDVTFCNV